MARSPTWKLSSTTPRHGHCCKAERGGASTECLLLTQGSPLVNCAAERLPAHTSTARNESASHRLLTRPQPARCIVRPPWSDGHYPGAPCEVSVGVFHAP